MRVVRIAEARRLVGDGRDGPTVSRRFEGGADARSDGGEKFTLFGGPAVDKLGRGSNTHVSGLILVVFGPIDLYSSVQYRICSVLTVHQFLPPFCDLFIS
jgi:hypothetical protein